MIRLRVEHGYWSKTSALFHFVEPRLVEVTPREGVTSGGTNITIVGAHLDAGTNVTVLVGNVDCAVGTRNATAINCVTGELCSGTYCHSS